MRSCSGCYAAVLSKNFGIVSCLKLKDIVPADLGLDCPYYRRRRTDHELRRTEETV